MADDDDINIFEEFYDSIKPGGSFDQGALNIGKAVTDVLTPNEQTQAEMDAVVPYGLEQHRINFSHLH